MNSLNRSVYTISPSWLIKNKKDLKQGIHNLEKLGLKVINKSPLLKLPSPEEKARQIHRAFLDKNTGIIIARRGGASSMKVLPRIDFNLIKNNPKFFAGFSDLSTLLNAIFERTGLITFHAPMIINFTNPSPFTVKSFLNALGGYKEKNLLRNAPVTVYKHGKTKGILKGGNLVTLSTLTGTPWELKTDNAILFFEDVDEKLHEVDRYLAQWILAGKFDNISGLILGNFRGIKHTDVFKIIKAQMKITFPVIHCPYIGHVKNKITIPVGATATLDTRDKSLIISVM